MEKGKVSPRRRWPWLLGGAVFVLALLVAGVWLARKPLATRYADRFLASKGVPARYRIANLGFGRQRLVDVVLGDPSNPDLVADWLEARTVITRGGPELTGVRGGHVRLRARWVNGRLSLGSVDRLLPPPSGKAFALPKLDVAVEDARVRLETPWGVAGLKIAGSGRLDDGFAGRAAVVSPSLAVNGCGASALAAALKLRSAGQGRVALAGPVQARSMDCGGVRVAALRSMIQANWLSGQPRGSTLEASVLTGPLAHRLAQAGSATAQLRLVHGGGATFTALGQAALRAARGFGATARRVSFAGTMAKVAGFGLNGKVEVADASATALVPRLPDLAAGTPLAPLLARLRDAGAAAARRFSGTANLTLRTGPQATAVQLRGLQASSASGARAVLAAGEGLRWSSGGQLGLDGTLDIAGGGLPTVSARVAQQGDARRILLTMAPYEAGGARLALTPALVTSGKAGLTLRTVATLSGPLGNGRVDGLTVPIDLVQTRSGLLLNRACAPVNWKRLAISGLVLNRATLRLCPTESALVASREGRVSGGAVLGATRLSGRIGSTPLTLAAAGARLRLADRGFVLDGVRARLGQPGRMTRIDAASLQGTVTGNTVVGRFAGAGGQVGAVPLLMSDAAGQWRFANGALTLSGGLTVSDAQTDKPRFRPAPLREIAFRLVGNRIDATGVLRSPGEARKVADVRLTHDLGAGVGHATFTVPGLVFDKALQPDQLTPLTLGVIADVAGTVTGDGRIDWTPTGVTSTGVFRTADTDLAAAFGPAEGIAGEIHFTDLLALKSAPGQRFTVRSVNPGIAVTDGVVLFQTLPDSRVQVEGARWPFAGGTLTLEPTLLDFGTARERRMTFRVEGVETAKFLQQFDFKNLNATGIFDGELPMVFDAAGGRIENGHLAVRPGGGTIAYVGAVSQKNLGFWGNYAFQVLKSLRYRSLGIVMNGPLAGEMVTEVRFAGISQGVGAKSNFIIRRLQKLPIVFNIRIRAPFRGLLDSTASFYDPERLIRRNLPQLLEEQQRQSAKPSVQPPASETVP